MDAAELLQDPLGSMPADGLMPQAAIVIAEVVDPETGQLDLLYAFSEMPQWRAQGLLATVLKTLD